MKFKTTMLLLIFILMVIASVSVAWGDDLGAGDIYKPELSNVTYVISSTFNCTGWTLDNYCFNITGGSKSGNYCNTSIGGSIIYIPSTDVVVELNSPSINYETSTPLINFRYTVSSNALDTCFLYWGTTMINSSTLNGTNNFQYFTGLGVGDTGLWYVFCNSTTNDNFTTGARRITRTSSGSTGGGGGSGTIVTIDYNVTPINFLYKLENGQSINDNFKIHNLDSINSYTIELYTQLDVGQKRFALRAGEFRDVYFNITPEQGILEGSESIIVYIIKNLFSKTEEEINIRYYVDDFKELGEECWSNFECYSNNCTNFYCEFSYNQTYYNSTEITLPDSKSEASMIENGWVKLFIGFIFIIAVLSYLIYYIQKRRHA